MNKAILSILMLTLVPLTGGCSYISEFIKARKDIEEQPVKPISLQVNTDQDGEEEVFADLEVEPVVKVAGLIPATDPDVRAKLVARGRNDPFSLISMPSKIEFEPVEVESEDIVETTQNNRRDRPPNQTEESVRRNSEPISPESISPELPPIDPTLARNVQILGLYEAPNGATKLIVRAPEESNSRYVEVGQYLSNGEVLVKSIDYNRSAYPQIVLEQSGIEVFKSIGEEPNETTKDVSFLPPAYESLQG